jgi:thioredoxin-related protein
MGTAMTIRFCFALMGMLASFSLHAAEAASAVGMGAYHGGKATEYPAWFKHSFLDLRQDIGEAQKAGKRVLLMFTQDNCPYCAALVERNLSQREIEATLKEKFDVIAVNLWGDREVVGLDGKTYTEKSYGAALKIQFTPSLLFFDEAGKTILRLNGYVPPARLQAALDWVSGRHEKTVSFRDFVVAREVPKQASSEMIKQDFFLKNATDLRRRGQQARPLAVFFEQKDCPDCEVLHRRVLADPEAREAIEKFDNVQFDMWSRTYHHAGRPTHGGSRLVRQLGVNYAPASSCSTIPAGSHPLGIVLPRVPYLGMLTTSRQANTSRRPTSALSIRQDRHIREAGRTNIWATPTNRSPPPRPRLGGAAACLLDIRRS